MIFPWPPKELFPNRTSGKHWASVRKAKDKYKQDSYFIAFTNPKPLSDTVSFSLTFCPPDRRRRDLDNCLAACKYMFDGIAQAWQMDDKDFRPISIDFGPVIKGGQIIVEVKNMVEVKINDAIAFAKNNADMMSELGYPDASQKFLAEVESLQLKASNGVELVVL